MKVSTHMFKGKAWTWIIATVAVAAVALVIMQCWPPSRRKLTQAAAVIESTSRYELKAGNRIILTWARDSCYSAACWMNRLALIPSCGGRLITFPEPSADTLTRLNDARIRQLIAEQSRRLTLLIKGKETEYAEVRYYLRVHGVQDEGYDMIAKFGHQLSRELDSLKRTAGILKKTDSLKQLRINRRISYVVIYRQPTGREIRTTCRAIKISSTRMILRTLNRRMPTGAKAVSIFPWTTGIPDYIYLSQYGDTGRRALRRPAITRHLTIRTDCITDTLDGQGTLVNGRRCYKGGLKAGKYNGYGVLKEGDSIVYSGHWQAGKRQGEGWMTDSCGRRIRGRFAADTLYYAIRHDFTGIYEGQTNRSGCAIGHGIYQDNSGRHYEGKWSADQRNGFGFSVAPYNFLQAGEWRGDRYRGERLVYTSERIYGIDISKYQHEIRKRKYPIHWDRLRITHLGTISRKRVNGTVSYPVSFIYIKSTEGSTIRNRYYAADYRQALSHGIRVGSYHFFSTTSPAVAQARQFVRHSQFQKGDLPPVLDLEPYPSQIQRMGGTAVLWNHVRTWLRLIQQYTGVKPVLYISQTFVNKYLPEAPDIKKNYPVWIARYGEYKPDVKLVYWQLSPDGRVDGIKGAVDINVFNGYQNVFNDYLKKSTIR